MSPTLSPKTALLLGSVMLGLTGCATTPTVTPGRAECPPPKEATVTRLPEGLFPDAPMIDRLPPGSDTVLAASTIRASRTLTEQHNAAKGKNVQAANDFVRGQVDSYNRYLAGWVEECISPPEPPPEPRRKRFGLF